jgi:nucleoside-diphosphate kinase
MEISWKTLVLVKPDGVQRGVIGEVVGRLARRGLRLAAARFCRVSRSLAEEHYAVHRGKPFYPGLVDYITSAPVLAMVWEGPQAVAAVRQTMGATRPTEAAPGTVRHDLAMEIGRNLCLRIWPRQPRSGLVVSPTSWSTGNGSRSVIFEEERQRRFGGRLCKFLPHCLLKALGGRRTPIPNNALIAEHDPPDADIFHSVIATQPGEKRQSHAEINRTNRCCLPSTPSRMFGPP